MNRNKIIAILKLRESGERIIINIRGQTYRLKDRLKSGHNSAGRYSGDVVTGFRFLALASFLSGSILDKSLKTYYNYNSNSQTCDSKQK